MSYMHDYSSLDEVIGTTAETPYTGLIHGNKRVVFASKEKYGKHVLLVRDEKYDYFKPESYKLITTKLVVSSNSDGGIIVVNESMGVDCLYIYDYDYYLIRKSGNDFISGSTKYYAYDGSWFGEKNIYVTIDNSGDNILALYSIDSNNNLYDCVGYEPNCNIIKRKKNEENFQQNISVKKGEKVEYTVIGKILTLKDIESDSELLNSITYFEIPETMTEIGDYDFDGCVALKEIKLNDYIVTIGKYSFRTCENLQEILFPNSLETIGECAFCNCEKLNNFIIPDSVKSIKGRAFELCKSLTKIEIPDSVTFLGIGAFCNCSSLENIKLPSYITTIEDALLSNCEKLTNIVIPDKVVSLGHTGTGFGIGAFSGCLKLKNITLPETLETIGNYSFTLCCSLEKITIPETVNYIGEYAFESCSSLQSIKLTKNVAVIEEGAFSECSSITYFTVPKGIINISNYTFRNCSKLAKINIPNTVKKIGLSAFDGCVELSSVVFDGTSEEWKSIEKRDNWHDGMPESAIITCNSDGEELALDS